MRCHAESTFVVVVLGSGNRWFNSFARKAVSLASFGCFAPARHSFTDFETKRSPNNNTTVIADNGRSIPLKSPNEKSCEYAKLEEESVRWPMLLQVAQENPDQRVLAVCETMEKTGVLAEKRNGTKKFICDRTHLQNPTFVGVFG